MVAQATKTTKSATTTKGKKGPIPKLSGKELCIICGAKSTGFNYGVLSCEGCKAFYRRSVLKIEKTNQGNETQIQNIYSCIGKEVLYSCNLFNQGRSKCRACRFFSCRKAGMNLLGRYQQSPEFLENKSKIKDAQKLMISKNQDLIQRICQQEGSNQIDSNKIEAAHINNMDSIKISLEADQLNKYDIDASELNDFELLSDSSGGTNDKDLDGIINNEEVLFYDTVNYQTSDSDYATDLEQAGIMEVPDIFLTSTAESTGL